MDNATPSPMRNWGITLLYNFAFKSNYGFWIYKIRQIYESPVDHSFCYEYRRDSFCIWKRRWNSSKKFSEQVIWPILKNCHLIRGCVLLSYARAKMNHEDSFLKSKEDVLLLERFHSHFTIMEKQWAGWWLKWWELVHQEGNPRTGKFIRCFKIRLWILYKECTGLVWLILFKKVFGLTIMAMKLTCQLCQQPLIMPVVHSTV